MGKFATIKKSKKKFAQLIFTCIFVIPKRNNKMKNEITYKNRTIIEGTNGLFTAYYSNYSSSLTKEFKTLEKAKKQIDKWVS